ncbi:MAG: hypothetical protein IJ542_00185 [Clostridia bacterium]|nr:hypothetical protein [Clostridia bacterium]
MTEQEKIEALKQLFAKNDIDFFAPDVQDFLYRKRNLASCSGRGHEFVRPVLYKLYPLNFENNSYDRKDSGEDLSHWIFYQNSSDNQLFWENIGNNQFDIKQSFVNRKQIMPVYMGSNGKFYNNNDGNHRLLTLIVSHFIERKRAKSPEEVAAVDKKYEMVVPVQLPVKDNLADLLVERTMARSAFSLEDDSKRIFPRGACEYRSETIGDKDYFLSFDPQTNNFSYEFNDDTFVGTQDEIYEYLKNKNIAEYPIMTWNDGKTYYFSYNNRIFKSTNQQKIRDIKNKVLNQLEEGKSEYHAYVEINDLDANMIEFRYPNQKFDVSDDVIRDARMSLYYEIICDSNYALTFKKVAPKEYERVKDLIEYEVNHSWDLMNVTEIKISNVSPEEYNSVKRIFEAIEKGNIKISKQEEATKQKTEE